MCDLRLIKYPPKISISFAILVVILVVSAIITSVAVYDIINQFDKWNRTTQVIHNLEETRLLVSDYIQRPSRDEVQRVHNHIYQTRHGIEAISSGQDRTLQQNMLMLLDEFQIQFQKYVIITDQSAAIKSQTIDLGRSMVTQISEESHKVTQNTSRVSLALAKNQILNILWQGQALITAGFPLTQEHLAPIQRELNQLSPLTSTNAQGLSEGRLLFRIHRDIRDYVASFKKFLEYETLLSETNELLNSISIGMRDAGNQLSNQIGDDIEQRLINVVSSLILLLIVSIAASLFLSRFLSKEIVRPIKNLVEATKEIADGNLSLNVSAEVDDELGELANCLSHMAEKLLISHASLADKNLALTQGQQELERRVYLRTQELAKANESLEAEIRSRTQSENQIRASEAKFRAMFELSPLGIIRSTLDGNILECNQSFMRMFGYSSEAEIHASGNMFTPEINRLLDHKELRQLATNQKYGPVEKELIKLSGETITVRLYGVVVSSDTGNSAWSLVEDISRQKLTEEMIWHQANFDELTGLPNRRMFQNRLELEIKHAKRTGTKFAVMLLDLDKFKEVNDTLGHGQGDQLLVEAGKRIRSCVRDSDDVARLGGDEFTLIITNIYQTTVLYKISKNTIKVLSDPFVVANQSIVIGASMGVTIYPDDATTPEKLMSNADQAMYAAKMDGRNRYSFFTPALQQNAVKRMSIINELRNAIKEQQLSLKYQPIVNIQTGEIPKAEALLRWQHPDLGAISPAEFIPLAEETGLIIDIGNWVLDEVLRTSQKLTENHHQNIQISINKSPIQFKINTQDLQQWIAKIQQVSLSGNSILIEITEGLLLDANENIRKILYTYRDEGIPVALDDFGTGYSSLSYLNKFDIDYLKIDRAFVSNLTNGSNELALYEAIIVMAHKLGLKVIAEGIEQSSQHELLVNIGCDYGQGFLYSKPVTADELIQLLDKRRHNWQSIPTFLDQ